MESLFAGEPSFSGATAKIAVGRFSFEVPRAWRVGARDDSSARVATADRRAYVGVGLAADDAGGRALVARLIRDGRLDEPVWEEPESTRLGLAGWRATAAYGPSKLAGIPAEAWVVVVPLGAERLVVVASVTRHHAALRRDLVATVRSLGRVDAPAPRAALPAPSGAPLGTGSRHR